MEDAMSVIGTSSLGKSPLHTMTLIDPKIIAELEKKFPDFVRAYDEKGMVPEEFEYFGATRRTLLAFLGGYADLVKTIRYIMISDPDLEG